MKTTLWLASLLSIKTPSTIKQILTNSLDTLKLFKIPFLRKRCKGHTDQSIGKKKRQWKTLRQSNVNYGEKQQQQPVFQGILPKNIISRAHVKKYVKHDH